MYPGTTLVTITAIPSPGYEFDHWEGALTGSHNPAAVLVASAKTVTAVFVTRFHLSIATSAGGAGVVTLNPPQPDNGHPAGTSVSLHAEASEGYVFDHWEGDLNGSDNPAELLISENKAVTAVFLPTFKVVFDTNPEGSGTVALDPPQPADGYTSGTMVSAVANASSGYVFDHWEESLSGSDISGTLVIDGSKQIVAVFRKSPSFHWWWIATGTGIFALAAGAAGLAYWKRKLGHAS